jgi:hypothetical protein
VHVKKALGGCLVVVLLAVIGGGVAGWWFLVRPAWNAGSELIGAAQQWAELAQMEQKVANRGTFTPPADGAIAPAALQRFLTVQQQIDVHVGDRLKTLEAKYDRLQAQHKSSGRDANLQEVLGAYGDVFGLIKETRQIQIDAINAQNLSLAEYRWLRNQSYRALGIDATAMATGKPGTETSSTDPTVVALRPHRDLLLRTAATTWIDF